MKQSRTVADWRRSLEAEVDAILLEELRDGTINLGEIPAAKAEMLARAGYYDDDRPVLRVLPGGKE